jgi:tetratricopeptide (TPR) repeat protein
MARRVNTRFLVILSIVVVGGGSVAITAGIIIKRRGQNPDRFVQEGKALMEEGRYTDAAPLLGRAVSLSQKDPDLRVLFGNAMERVAATEAQPRESIQRARAHYLAAVEIDGRHLPALRALLASYRAQAKVQPSADVLQAAADIAEKVLAVEPNDREALLARDTAVLRSWQRGVTTDNAKVETAIATLDQLAAADVNDPEPLRLLMEAYARKAVDALRASRSEQERLADARVVLDAAIAAIERAMKDPAAAKPVVVAVAVRGYEMIDAIDTDTDRSKSHTARAAELLASAGARVTADDPGYADIRVLQALKLWQANDRAGAETILRETVEKAPHAFEPRVTLAKVIGADPTRRDDAIAVYSQPFNAKPGADVFEIGAAKDAQLRMLIEATTLRIDAMSAATDPKVRDEQRAQVEKALANFKDMDAVPAAVLLPLQGKFELAQDKPIEAVKTLNDAMSAVNQAGGKTDDVAFLLGRAYAATKQTGQAKSMFLQVVDHPNYGTVARQVLAQLYLEDNQTKEALEQLDALEKITPNADNLQRARFAAYLKEGRRDEALAIYAKLPATTKTERLRKAQGALALNDRPAAIALLEDAAKAFPGDVEVAINLAQLYQAAQLPDQAKATIAAALEKNPDNGALKLLQARLSGESKQEIIEQAVVDAKNLTDPFQRAVQLAELSRMGGKLDEAMKHLDEAEKVKPGEGSVADLRFNLLLAMGKFDEAAALVPALVKADQDKAGGLIYKFRLALAQNKPRDAEALGLELTQKMPAFAQSWLCYGQALQAQNKPIDAIDKYNRALERQSGNADAYRGLIDCYYAAGKPDDALRYIQQARKTLPADQTFREAELNHAQNFGDPTPVIAIRQEALKAAPEDKARWQQLATVYLKAAQFHAPRVDGKKLADGYLAQAKDLLAKAVEKWPAERAFAALFADVALSLNDASSAERVLKKFAEQEAWKDKTESKMMLGELYARTGRPVEAEDAFNAALKRSNEAPEVRQRFAAFLAQQGKVTGALELLPADDKSPAVRGQRINLLSAAGRFKEAEEAVKASLAIEPDVLDTQALLASVYLDQGRFEDADAQATTVLAKDAKHQMALYVRGLVKLRRPNPDPDGAITDLAAVNETNPRNVDVRLALADAQRQRGNSDAAMNTLATGLQLNKANKVLRLRLLDLYASNDRRSDVDFLIAEAATIASLQADPEWLAAEANAYATREDFTKAAGRLKAALALAPGNGNLQNAYIGLLTRARNYKAAIAEADKVLATGDAWWAHQQKAVARKAMNDKAGATADLKAALKSAEGIGNDDAVAAVISTWAQQIDYDEALAQLKPRLDRGVRWHIQAASLNLEKKDYAAARAALDSAMAGYDAASPNEQLQLLRFAGSFYLSVLPPDPDRAKEVYDKLLAKTPNDLASLNNVACLLAESVTPPQPDKALEYSTRAYEMLRRNGRFDALIFDTQGWVLVLNNRIDDGIEVLRQVVNRVPFAEAHYHLAEAYLRLANPYPEEAQRQLALAQTAYEAAAKTRSVDPALKSRIDESLAKAKAMIKDGKATSAAPAADAN